MIHGSCPRFAKPRTETAPGVPDRTTGWLLPAHSSAPLAGPHAPPFPRPRPPQDSGGGSTLPIADWLASHSPAPGRAQEAVRTRAARSRGEASPTLVRAPGRGVLDLHQARLRPQGPPALAARLRTPGLWLRSPPAVPGCRSPEDAGLKGQCHTAAAPSAPSERPGQPEEARLPQPAGPCDWRRRPECCTS